MTSVDVFTPISLIDLTAQAELLQRYDTKYLMPISQLPDVYQALASHMMVLEHNGTRSTSYTTSYYDTSDLKSYHDHLKGRRKRFKIRARHYEHDNDGYLEIKIKKPRGQTLKVRWTVNVLNLGDSLNHEHMTSINDSLLSASYDHTDDHYVRTLETTFDRITLFDVTSHERITIDTSLAASYASRTLDLGRHCVIIEIKSPSQVGHAHRLFTNLGIRPINISKYCAALSAFEPSLRGAPWRHALRELQGSGNQQHNANASNY
jgi:hypothetical protein